MRWMRCCYLSNERHTKVKARLEPLRPGGRNRTGRAAGGRYDQFGAGLSTRATRRRRSMRGSRWEE